MPEYVDPVMLRRAFAAKLRDALQAQSLTIEQAAKAAGVVPVSLRRYLNASALPRAEVLSRLNQALGLTLDVRTECLLLREARAASSYRCVVCSSIIREGARYFSDEPTPWDRRFYSQSARPICTQCVVPAPREPGDEPGSRQLSLPIDGAFVPNAPSVKIVDFTDDLVRMLKDDPAFVYRIRPDQFENLVVNRLDAMKLSPHKVGHTYRKDGGIDIVFSANQSAPFPFLGAVQVKHHRDPCVKVAAPEVRAFGGVLNSLPFAAGLIVTNTSFTADARWAASHQRALMRLRDMQDLMRWIRENFVDLAEWRELPECLEVCPGLTIPIRDHFAPVALDQG